MTRAILLSMGLLGCASPARAPSAPSPPAASDPGAAKARAAAKRTAHADGMAAYERKDYAVCGRLLAEADDPYDAACCHARAGALDAAFGQLDRAVDTGLDQDFTHDEDLVALHGDARWQAALDRQAAKRAAHDQTLNAELIAIYRADQADRAAPSYEQIDWSQVTPRDHARRDRVDAIVAAGQARVADDYYHAAMVYQHGESPAEIQRAHDLALRAVELEPTHKQARWLAAASEDRKLMYESKAQKWGTQLKKVDGKWIVWPVDPAITDDQRDAWAVPPLAESEGHAAAMNAKLKVAADPKAAPPDAKATTTPAARTGAK